MHSIVNILNKIIYFIHTFSVSMCFQSPILAYPLVYSEESGFYFKNLSSV